MDGSHGRARIPRFPEWTSQCTYLRKRVYVDHHKSTSSDLESGTAIFDVHANFGAGREKRDMERRLSLSARWPFRSCHDQRNGCSCLCTRITKTYEVDICGPQRRDQNSAPCQRMETALNQNHDNETHRYGSSPTFLPI